MRLHITVDDALVAEPLVAAVPAETAETAATVAGAASPAGSPATTALTVSPAAETQEVDDGVVAVPSDVGHRVIFESAGRRPYVITLCYSGGGRELRAHGCGL